jgi:hypothetical protein
MKRVIVTALLFFAAAVAFLFSSAGRIALGKAETAYYQAQWNSKAPTTYYMELTIFDLDNSWRWAATVHNDKVVSSMLLEGTEGENWFRKYDFTVDSILEAGEDFCYRMRECLIKFDSVYYFPEIIAIGSRAIQIDRFEACTKQEECGTR